MCYATYIMAPIRRPLRERFQEKVDRNGPVPAHRPELGPCHLWTAATDAQGYGRVNLGGRTAGTGRAHVVAFELEVEPANGRCILHRCDNPPCVKALSDGYGPAHLFPGDRAVNNRDMAAKGRTAQQKRTHCPQGHAYAEHGYRTYRGGRLCKACRRVKRRIYRTQEEQREMRRRMGRPRAERTNCPQGHPYDEDNTRHTRQGRRACRTCERARTRAWKAARKASA